MNERTSPPQPETLTEEALKQQRQQIDTVLRSALEFHSKGDSAQGVKLASMVAEKFPLVPETYSVLGIIAHQQERYGEAVSHFTRALALAPHVAANHSNLGSALQKDGRDLDALRLHKKALEIDPNSAEAYFNMAIALFALGRLEECIEAYDKVVSLKPGLDGAFHNLHNALSSAGDDEMALKYQDDALKLGVDTLRARYNRSLLLLRLGRLKEGFDDYETRWQQPTLPKLPPMVQGRQAWQGEDLAGKTLFVHAEQGLGDMLQFCRYFPLIKQRYPGAKLVVNCGKPLLKLLKGSGLGVDRWIEEYSETPEFDYYCPLMSLPHVFGTDLDSVPAALPYLTADAALVEKWRGHVAEGEGLKVGLVWAGAKGHKNDHNRSVTLQTLAPVLAVPGVQFYSLQKGRRATELALAMGAQENLLDLGGLIGDFADTAAIIAQLDLVITVDTSVAHLAGAMGKPVWVLLPFVPDWRWMTEREDSPWYPGCMQLFRQPDVGQWAPAIEAVRTGLEALAEGKTAQPFPLEMRGEAMAKLAEILAHKGHTEQAASIYTAICRLAPLQERYYFRHAELLENLGRRDETLAAIQSLLLHQHDNEAAYVRLSALFKARGDITRAAKSLEQALLYRPNDVELLVNYSNLLRDVQQDEKRVSVIDRILALRKADAPLPENFVSLPLAQKSALMEKMIVQLRYNRSHYWLKKERYKEGFTEHELRWLMPENEQLPKDFHDEPLWDGRPLPNGSLFVYGELGRGDVIQFARYYAWAKQRVGRLVISAEIELHRLLGSLGVADEILAKNMAPKQHDAFVPLMTLATLYARETGGILPAPAHYNVQENWGRAAKALLRPRSFNVALTWAGNPKYGLDTLRSLQQADILPLLAQQKATFYLLQKGAQEQEAIALAAAHPNVVSLGNVVEDYADSAGVLAQMDLVISSDTSVLHLAASLGKPCFALISAAADWRWLETGESNPWYNSIRVFRQEKVKRWDKVIAEVGRALHEKM